MWYIINYLGDDYKEDTINYLKMIIRKIYALIRQRRVAPTLLKAMAYKLFTTNRYQPNLIPLLTPLSNLDFNSIEE